MKVAAFDAKPFERVSPASAADQGDRSGRRGFRTQLGVGVVVGDKDEFRDKFTAKFAELANSFGIRKQVPFCPSSHLLRHERAKAVAFSDQLVSSVQDMIESVHCFYVILPPSEPDTVRVGGFGCAAREIPTWLFIKNLGPMFSYMTAHDYLYQNSDLDTSNIEFHIDAFMSRETKSWDKLVGRVRPMVFWRGDECNPFIACADIMAFLTDAKLRHKHLWLRRDNITSVWSDYAFKTTVHYVDRKGISIHAWHNDEPVDPWPYVARPTIFLAMDSLAQDHGAKSAHDHDGAEARSLATNRGSAPKTSPSNILVKTPVYTAAVRYAFAHSASLKFFNRHEDFGNVCDRDIFVYIGPESERIGRMLQDAVHIDVMSGVELRNKEKKGKKLPSN